MTFGFYRRIPLFHIVCPSVVLEHFRFYTSGFTSHNQLKLRNNKNKRENQCSKRTYSGAAGDVIYKKKIDCGNEVNVYRQYIKIGWINTAYNCLIYEHSSSCKKDLYHFCNENFVLSRKHSEKFSAGGKTDRLKANKLTKLTYPMLIQLWVTSYTTDYYIEK